MTTIDGGGTGASVRQPLGVLITGVGAPPGVSIFKAFRQSALEPWLVATDADPISAGLHRADAAYLLPRVSLDGDGYSRGLEELCRRERVSLVCLGSEAELLHASRHREAVERRTGARVVVNAPDTLDTLMDKWRLTEALRARDLPVPDTALGADLAAVRALVAAHGFPLIVKPRHGSGSRNLHLVHGEQALAASLVLVPDAVVQEHLVPDDQEYSVGVYRSPRQGYVGQIVFRRTLAAGLTYKAEVVRDPEIEAVCRRTADAFDLWGPINVQLRKTARGPRIFEINPRFSSSAVMRAGMGFNEAELCLRDLVLQEHLEAPVVRPGRVLRFWDELYLSPAEDDALRAGAATGIRGRRVADF